eukprot:EG_transcript_29961
MIDLTAGHVAQCAVSSVLNRDTRQFGKAHLFTPDAEGCWQSQPGSPQSITLTFRGPVRLQELRLTSQGGFCGRHVQLLTAASMEEPLALLQELHPADTNAEQRFSCEAAGVVRLQLLFPDSTDLYGRIVVYRLQVLGEPPSSPDAAAPNLPPAPAPA